MPRCCQTELFISSLRQPLVVIVIRLARPPVKELVQRFDILVDVGAAVLLGITVDGDLMMTVGRKLYNVDAVARPALVSIKASALHIPEPLVLHFLRNVSPAERLHLLIGERTIKDKHIVTCWNIAGLPVLLAGYNILRCKLLQSVLSEVKNDPVKHSQCNVYVSAGVIVEKIAASLYSLAPSLISRIPINACRDQRKADRMTAVLRSKLQRAAIRTVKQLRLLTISAVPYGTDSVDNIFRFEIKSRSDNSRARVAVPDSITGSLQLVPTRSSVYRYKSN